MAETTVTDLTASATTIVDATPAEVFAYVTRPANHPIINGDGTVKGDVKGPEQLTAEGQKFNVSMKQYGLPYRIDSKVVEYEQDRRIAWAHLGKHRWRWEVEPTADGRTKVTETFDMGPSFLKPLLKHLLQMPGAHEGNVAKSVDNVAAHFASS